MRTATVLGSGVLALSLALPASSAEAATRVVRDGPDGYALPAHENVTRVVYRNNAEGFAATLRIQDMNRKRTQSVGFNLHVGPGGRAIDVFVTRFAGGRIRNSVGISPDREEPSESNPCPTLTASWRARTNLIQIVVPWSCLADLRQDVKVDAFFSPNDGTHGDPSDFVRQVKVRYR